MNSWSKTPFVRILIPFIIGLLLYRSEWLPIPAGWIFTTTLALLVILSAWLFIFPQLNTHRTHYFQGFLILLCVLMVSWLLSFNQDNRNRIDFIGHLQKDKPVKMILNIDNTVEQKNNTLKTTATALAWKTDSSWMKCCGTILLYISNPDSAIPLEYGDKIAAEFWLSDIQNPLFNSDFDYKKYLADKNIYHQAYIADDQYTILEKGCGNPLISFALDIRDRMVNVLQSQLGNNDEYAVVSAMLIGYRANISADMMRAYSQAGVIHIMSVSGLHVGVIYIMITALMGIFGWFKKRKWISVALVLSLIWFYALLTGLSASVLRSAVMITFVVIGNAMQRSINPYNSLSAAAFILLSINPGSIGEIGFQLSFIAVLGILLFHRPIYNLWHIKNKWIDKIWALACVSVAAQLTTLPFILYYFGQFPVYFLISNIIVVPLSSLVLYAGMTAVLLSWIPWVSAAATFITLWLTKAMNFIVLTIEALPNAVISNIYLSAWATVILVLIIATAYLMFRKRKIKLLYPIIILAIAATFFQWESKNKIRRQQEAFIVKDGDEYIVGVKQNESVYLMLPSDTFVMSAYLQSRLSRFSERNSLQTITIGELFNDSLVFRHGNFMGWNQFRMINWPERKMPQAFSDFPKTDLMLASKLSKYYFEKHHGSMPAKIIMSKIHSVKPSLLNISEKKEWKFRMN